MSFRHNIDFKCDNCDHEYMLNEGMELPPSWMGVQIAFANTKGVIPEDEQEIFSHFCSLKCLIEFVQSDEIKERFFLADQNDEDGEEDDDDDEPSTSSGESEGGSE